MSIWFTADPHYWHSKILELGEGRPFAHLTEMHETMILNWNNRVKSKTCRVYVLGDFSFGGVQKTANILRRLNGYKILIKGNHDMPAHKILKAGFDEVHENIYIEINNGNLTKKVFLSHFPYFSKNPLLDQRYIHKRMVDQGDWLLHGHVHSAWQFRGRQINVGVDKWGFAPVSHSMILDHIQEKECQS